ncbi:MAG: 2OG-Fe(II) oxygenase [Parvularculaceae bacterium]|nr:2OG-Fe(II) oxygenase [Parvularculaceae bacterium]
MSDPLGPRVRRLFATPLIELDLPDSAALNAALVQVIAARRATHGGISRSNVGGWHSDTEMAQWGGEAGRRVALEALKACGAYTHDMGMKGAEPRFQMGVEMWANVLPAGAVNQHHAHGGALWSAVYYVDDGGDRDSGSLVLLDPRFPMNRMYSPDLVFAENGEMEETTVRIAPTPGRMVIFPSWLMHGVRPHAGPRERISIAINVVAIRARK